MVIGWPIHNWVGLEGQVAATRYGPSPFEFVSFSAPGSRVSPASRTLSLAERHRGQTDKDTAGDLGAELNLAMAPA